MEKLRILKVFRDEDDAHKMVLEGVIGTLAGIYHLRLDLRAYDRLREILRDVPFKAAKNTKGFEYPVTGTGEAKGGREHFLRVEIHWEERSKVYKVPVTGSAAGEVRQLLEASEHDVARAIHILSKG